MFNLSNNKQLTNSKQHRIGSLGKQQSLFPLVHLILCYFIVYSSKCQQEESCLTDK
jgi:hypothetical protein